MSTGIHDVYGTNLYEKQRKKDEFQPYENNGGTCLAIAGSDFCIMAADTRLSEGYSILARNNSRALQLTSKAIVVSSGCQADISGLFKTLQYKVKQYKFKQEKEVAVESAAQMLGNELYGRRFFPYYTFNIIGGIDEAGTGYCAGYDAVGSFHRESCSCQGSGQQLMMGLLDNLVAGKNINPSMKDALVKLSKEEAKSLLKDAFASAAERDIFTGDYVEIFIITKEGTTKELYELRHD
eukprot:GCRY01001424.1.p1 GENE.GCRY01001424.1~~GCRY01001424.1.p1  ORF type:complete len:238 (+),score=33.03 GCRY01001424.1:125-838(+)